MNMRKLLGAGLALVVLMLVLAPLALAQGGGDNRVQAVIPSVTVNDQPIVNGTVTVARVVAASQGWIAIHPVVNGVEVETPIGYAPVHPGENLDVVVPLDLARLTPVLHAMLHIDAGIVGTFEFPGPDAPVVVNGRVVDQPFHVLGDFPRPTTTAQPTVGATATPTPLPPTATRTPSPTPLPPTATRTPSPTPLPPTATRTPLPTFTPTTQPTVGATATPTRTPSPTATTQPTVRATATATLLPTATRTPSSTPSPTIALATSTASPTATLAATSTATLGPPTELPVTGSSVPPWSLVILALGGLILIGGLGLALARRQ